jgi:hypothetical protein
MFAALASPVRADSKEHKPAAEQPKEETGFAGAVALSAALVPGVLVHGSGHFVAGDKSTARRLLLMEGIGLGMAAVGGATLGLTGANRHINGSSIPLLVSGIGVFAASWVADIYGVSTRGSTQVADADRQVAVSLGYGYVRDPLFAYNHFAVTEGLVRLERFSVRPTLWTAATADNQRARLVGGYMLFEDWHGLRAGIDVGATHHRFGDDGFTSTVGEVAATGRWELGEISRTLRGSFARLDLGLGYQYFDYHLDGVEGDGSTLLLNRWGYGFYLPGSGEIELYYNHRRDNFTAGASPSTRNGSGFMGQWGIRLRQPVSAHLAIVGRSEIASAWLSLVALEARWDK